MGDPGRVGTSMDCLWDHGAEIPNLFVASGDVGSVSSEGPPGHQGKAFWNAMLVWRGRVNLRRVPPPSASKQGLHLGNDLS